MLLGGWNHARTPNHSGTSRYWTGHHGNLPRCDPVADKPDTTPDATPVKPDSGGENTAILPEPPRCRPKQFKDCVTCYLEKHHEWLSEVDPVWRDKNPMCMALEAGLNPSSSVTTQEH